MPSFRYTALDEQQRSVTGEITAATVRNAIESLEGQSLEVLSIGQLDPVDMEGQESKSANTSTLRQAFENLFAHRDTLAPALTAYSEELSTDRVRGEVKQVVELFSRGDVDRAVSSFDALADHWTPLLSAASTHSDNHLILAEYLRRSTDPQVTRQFTWSPLVYPLMLLALSAAIVVAMSVMLIPTFRDIFNEFDLELPEATRLVLAIADAISSGRVFYGVLVVVLILLGAWLVVRRLPVTTRATIGRWTLSRRRRIYLNGQLATYVADLLQAGLSRRESLEEAATAIRHPAIAASAMDFAERLHARRANAKSCSDSSLSHILALAMTKEMSNQSRVHLLRELSQDYRDQTTRYLPWKQQLLLGPITLLVVGFTVGFTVLALFLPLVKLVEGLT